MSNQFLPTRLHVAGCLAVGFLAAAVAVSGRVEAQAQLQDGRIVPSWRLTPGLVKSILPGMGATKFVFALISVGGFIGALALANIAEEIESVLARERRQDEEIYLAQKRALTESDLQKMQLEGAKELEAHEVIAESKAKHYFAAQMGIPVDQVFDAELVEPATVPAEPKAAIPEQPAPSPAVEPVDPGSLRVLLGSSPDGQQIHWQPNKHPNGFMLMLGGSGSGKTESLKALSADVHGFGIPVLILDFHGDIDVPSIPTTMLSHAPATPIGINPMELDSLDPLDGGVYPQVLALLAMLQTAIPGMGHKQYMTIKKVLERAYQSKGMSNDKPESWTKPAPTFGVALADLEAIAENPELPANLRSVAESALAVASRVFEHPVFNKREWLNISSLTSSSHRLDLSKLPDDVQFIVADTILRKAMRSLRSRGPIPVAPDNDRERYRLFVAVDEAKLLSMGGRNKDDKNSALNKIATEYRKFGLGMLLASQMSDHFSSELKAQTYVRLALKPGQEREEIKANAQEMGLPESQLAELKGRGDGWLKAGQDLKRVQILPNSARNR